MIRGLTKYLKNENFHSWFNLKIQKDLYLLSTSPFCLPQFNSTIKLPQKMANLFIKKVWDCFLIFRQKMGSYFTLKFLVKKLKIHETGYGGHFQRMRPQLNSTIKLTR